MPGKINYKLLTRLNRADNIKLLPQDVQKDLMDLSHDPGSVFGDQLVNFEPLYPSIGKKMPEGKPTYNLRVGYQWTFFEEAEDKPIQFVAGRDAWKYGKKLTEAVLKLWSTTENKVLGIWRAHQHVDKAFGYNKYPLMENMITHHGVFTLWQPENEQNPLLANTVTTLAPAPDTIYGISHQESGYAKAYPGFAAYTELRIDLAKNNFTVKTYPVLPTHLAQLQQQLLEQAKKLPKQPEEPQAINGEKVTIWSWISDAFARVKEYVTQLMYGQ